MSTLDSARAAARAWLACPTSGGPNPVWRTCFSTDGTDCPTGIAPVCPDEDHDPDDGSVYTCCADPVIEVGSAALADYLVALLNADRSAS
ncbi:hypothetical protein [Streptomyces sp. NPDC001594]|uniref:hypothetical protein n=1 Tax=Streptomyces sp. NPDC001594 TaxID=3364590 RepID=UPI0036A80204